MPAHVHRQRLSLLFSLYLFIFFPLSFGNSTHALALTNPITIKSQTWFTHFPDYIDFTVNAADTTSTISKATISITFGPQQELLTRTSLVTPLRSSSRRILLAATSILQAHQSATTGKYGITPEIHIPGRCSK
jgi:hypothetical protein